MAHRSSSPVALSPFAALRLPLLALTLATLLVASLLLPSTAHAAPTLKEKEPNGTTSTAQPIPLGTTLQGSFDSTSPHRDNFTITVSKAGRLTLDFRFANDLGTSHYAWFDVTTAAGETIHSFKINSSEYDGAVLRSRAAFLAPGTYYLKLKWYAGAGTVWNGEAYTLTPTITPMVSESEPNDSTATADVISLGTTIYGSTLGQYERSYERDYYRLPLTATTTVQTDFRFVCNLGTERVYIVRLLDNRGDELLRRDLTGADCTGSGLRGARVTVPAGNLYVEVVTHKADSTTMGKQYSLTIQKASHFKDVTPGVEHYSAMVWMKEKGISTGWSDGTYRPLAPVNRDAMAAFLYRHAGSPRVTLPKSSPFRDVKPSDQHYTAIIWAYQQGISTGWSTSRGREFRPVQPIARDAMAAFLYRYADSPRYTPPASCFKDVARGQQFSKEMCWMKNQGISTGWSDGTYRPLQSVKRDAMAAFLYRYSTR